MRRIVACFSVAGFFACLLLPAPAFAGGRWTIGLSTSGTPIDAVAIAGRSDSSLSGL